MSTPAIRVENLGKSYKLGLTHSGSIRELVNKTAGKLFGKADIKSVEIAESHKNQIDEENNFWALKGISFDVPQGEVLGVIGKNGAGKSTLLKLLSQITTPTTGRIEIRGRVAALLEVGTGFHPELTGRENVYLNGTILGMTKAEVKKQFDAIVDFAGVEQFIDTPVKRYSSGMTVRLGFAVAAHLDPEILIVDEVLAVGDVEFQKRCLEKMEDVSKSGRTVLFVSHNMASIRTLTTRALLISTGELKEIGATEKVVGYYLSPERRSMMGDDVTQLERPFGGLDGAIKFQELGFTSQQNSPAIIEDGELNIRMKIKSYKQTENFQIGLTIYRSDHNPVGSTFSSIIPSGIKGDVNEYHFTLPVESLAPGRYHCAISLVEPRSGMKIFFDALSDILFFEVIENGMEKLNCNRSWGAIRFHGLKLMIEFNNSPCLKFTTTNPK